MPALNTTNYSNEYSKSNQYSCKYLDGRRRKQKGIYTAAEGNRTKDYNYSQPRMKSAFSEDSSSPDSINKRMKRGDLTSWGGFDYTNDPNTSENQYQTVIKPRNLRISVNKNSKFHKGKELFGSGKVKIKSQGNHTKIINTSKMNILVDKGKVRELFGEGDSGMKPLMNHNEFYHDNHSNIRSPKTRGYVGQLERENSFTNANQTQANYFPK